MKNNNNENIVIKSLNFFWNILKKIDEKIFNPILKWIIKDMQNSINPFYNPRKK